jgi:hypothetical protein
MPSSIWLCSSVAASVTRILKRMNLTFRFLLAAVLPGLVSLSVVRFYRALSVGFDSSSFSMRLVAAAPHSLASDRAGLPSTTAESAKHNPRRSGCTEFIAARRTQTLNSYVFSPPTETPLPSSAEKESASFPLRKCRADAGPSRAPVSVHRDVPTPPPRWA